MAQTALPFQYEIERETTKLTAYAGLPLFEELGHGLGLYDAIRRHLHIREQGQGYLDTEAVPSLLHLQLVGGDHIDDLLAFNGDVGFSAFSRRMQEYRLSRRQRRVMFKRWRKERQQAHPSPSAAFRYLAEFHDNEIDAKRAKAAEDGIKAFIPEPTAGLRGLAMVNRDFVWETASHRKEITTATLDIDATLIATTKRGALYCYDKYPAYQPLNVWWSELGMMLHTEFRDGNVPAGYQILPVLEAAVAMLPPWITQVRVRMDTGGYDHDILRWCEEPKRRPEALQRFGRIEFAISSDVTEEFRAAVRKLHEGEWKPLHGRHDSPESEARGQYAEVCFVPNESAKSKKGQPYRYLATREVIRQLELPGVEPAPISEKLHPETLGGVTYKVFGVVTNRHTLDGEKLVHWQHERCGKSEAAHAILKNELGGGTMPSALFGVNAAWWWIAVLASNLVAALRLLILPERFGKSRIKALRLWVMNIPGRVIEHARGLIIRICAGSHAAELFKLARERIAALIAPIPSTA
jgi:hypothetical protein